MSFQYAQYHDRGRQKTFDCVMSDAADSKTIPYRNRRHSALGYLSPWQFEQRLLLAA